MSAAIPLQKPGSAQMEKPKSENATASASGSMPPIVFETSYNAELSKESPPLPPSWKFEEFTAPRGVLEQSAMLLGTAFVSYFLGRYRFGFIPVVGLCAVLMFVWADRAKESYRRIRHRATRDARLLKLDNELESLEWLNMMVQRVWLQIEPSVADQIVTQLNVILDEKKPAFLESLEISEFTLGSQAPRIESVRSFPRLGEDIVQLVVHLSFIPLDDDDVIALRQTRKSQLARAAKLGVKEPPGVAAEMRNVKVVLRAFVGKGVARLPIPIAVKNVGVEGKFLVRLRLTPDFPHVEMVTVAYPEEDRMPLTVSFDLVPLNAGNLIDLPGLRSFLDAQVSAQADKFLRAPGFTLNVKEMMSAPKQLDPDLAVGILKVRLFAARNLRNSREYGGTPNPYVCILVGPPNSEREVGRSSKVKASLSPTWDGETLMVLIKGHAFNNLSAGSDLVTFEVRDSKALDTTNLKSLGVMGDLMGGVAGGVTGVIAGGDTVVARTQTLPLAKWIQIGKNRFPSDMQHNAATAVEELTAEQKTLRANWGDPEGKTASTLPLFAKSGKEPSGDLQLELAYFPTSTAHDVAMKGPPAPAQDVAAKGTTAAAKTVEVPVAPPQKDIKSGILRITIFQAKMLDDRSNTNQPEAQSSNLITGVTGLAKGAVNTMASAVSTVAGPFAPYVGVQMDHSGHAFEKLKLLQVVEEEAENRVEAELIGIDAQAVAAKKRGIGGFMSGSVKAGTGLVKGIVNTGVDLGGSVLKGAGGVLKTLAGKDDDFGYDFETVIRRRTPNPIYNQTFETFCEDSDRAAVLFEVRNDMELVDDPLVGRLLVSAKEALESKHSWWQLTQCETGQLRLAFRFFPIDMEALGVAQPPEPSVVVLPASPAGNPSPSSTGLPPSAAPVSPLSQSPANTPLRSSPAADIPPAVDQLASSQTLNVSTPSVANSRPSSLVDVNRDITIPGLPVLPGQPAFAKPDCAGRLTLQILGLRDLPAEDRKLYVKVLSGGKELYRTPSEKRSHGTLTVSWERASLMILLRRGEKVTVALHLKEEATFRNHEIGECELNLRKHLTDKGTWTELKWAWNGWIAIGKSGEVHVAMEFEAVA